MSRRINDPDAIQTTPYTIAIDTREQAPFRFTNTRERLIVKTEIATLRTGDYSLIGFEDQLTIERKSRGDFLGSITAGRDRLEAEFERLNQMSFAAILIEAPWRSCVESDDEGFVVGTRITAKCVNKTFLSWMVRFPRVHWIWSEDRRHAEMQAFAILEKWWEVNGMKPIDDMAEASPRTMTHVTYRTRDS